MASRREAKIFECIMNQKDIKWQKQSNLYICIKIIN